MMMGELYTEVSVVFENVRFQRATNIPKEGNLEFIIMIQKGSGNFEVRNQKNHVYCCHLNNSIKEKFISTPIILTIMSVRSASCYRLHEYTILSQIVESGASIVTGRIYAKKNVGQDYRVLPSPPEVSGPNIKHLLTKDFYKELRLRGYQYR